MVVAALLFAVIGPASVLTDTPVGASTGHPITLPIDPSRAEDVRWTDTWGAPRSGGRSHIGVDMLGPKMVPLVAAADSEVVWGRFDNDRGSILRLRDADGWEYQYIHINNDTPETDDGQASCQQAFADKICDTLDGDRLQRGVTFEAGEFVAYLGDAGNAEWTAPHLHFEIYQPDGDDRPVPVNPTPFVDEALARLQSGEILDQPVGPFDSSSDAAEQITTRLEGRVATTGERLAIVDAIRRGGLAGGLADVVEANPSAAMIDRLYIAFFQRQADAEGMANWIAVRGEGQRLELIAEWFAQSEEFELRYGGVDFGEFLDRLYVDVLDRPADEEGKAYWLSELESGNVTRGSIVVYFTESVELRQATVMRTELTVLHRALGRPQPTAGEIDAWSTLRSTTTLTAAIETKLAEWL